MSIIILDDSIAAEILHSNWSVDILRNLDQSVAVDYSAVTETIVEMRWRSAMRRRSKQYWEVIAIYETSFWRCRVTLRSVKGNKARIRSGHLFASIGLAGIAQYKVYANYF